MLIKDGKEYYPIDLTEMLKNNKTYYSRNMREKSYFYLVLNTKTENQSEESASD